MTIMYWIQSGGSFANVTAADQIKLIREAATLISEPTKLRFERTKNKNKAIVKIRFCDNAEMSKRSKAKSAVGGTMVGPNMYLNNERKIGYSRSAIYLVAHEFGHWMGLKHSKDKSCLMHSNANRYLCPDDVRRLQKRHGVSKTIWWPQDKSRKGREAQALNWQFHKLRDERNRLADEKRWDEMLKKNKQVKVKLNRLIMANNEWWELKKRWSGIPMAG